MGSSPNSIVESIALEKGSRGMMRYRPIHLGTLAVETGMRTVAVAGIVGSGNAYYIQHDADSENFEFHTEIPDDFIGKSAAGRIYLEFKARNTIASGTSRFTFATDAFKRARVGVADVSITPVVGEDAVVSADSGMAVQIVVPSTTLTRYRLNLSSFDLEAEDGLSGIIDFERDSTEVVELHGFGLWYQGAIGHADRSRR